MQLSEKIYNRIITLCKENQMSVSELEEKLGLSRSTIIKWKNTFPTSKQLLDISDYFNISIDYLLCKTDIRSTVDDCLNDDDLKQFQRGKESMTTQNFSKVKRMLNAGFEFEFNDNNN